MRRGTFRVHGCGRCKKRKIKCDNGAPSCSQCKRIQKPCPGSSTGYIFQNTVTPTLLASASSGIVAFNKRQEVISRLSVELGSLNTSPWTPHHWFFVLPHLQLPAEFQHVALLPLQAMSIAFSALRSGDATLRLRALDYYAKGLAHQKRQLDLLNARGQDNSQEQILQPLLMALLLLEFEIMAPSSLHQSWIGHAYGSAHLLSLVGPEACQQSPFFEIFWQMRFTMGYVTLITGKMSYLDQPAWRETPFLSRGKKFLDKMVDPSHRGFQLDETGEANMTASRRMMQILENNRRLHSLIRPVSSPDDVNKASRFILHDAEYLLLQESTTFRMAMQCVFSIRVVAMFTPCNQIRCHADKAFKYWYSCLTL